MTNGDKIRQMSDEQMVEFFMRYEYYKKLPPKCQNCWEHTVIPQIFTILKWLKSEVEE